MKCHQKSHLGRSSVASAASGFVEVGPGGRWQAKSSGSHQSLSNIWISCSKVEICSIWFNIYLHTKLSRRAATDRGGPAGDSELYKRTITDG